MNDEEFGETEGWQLEGEAMFYPEITEQPPKPGSKHVVRARLTLGYDNGEQDNIAQELNAAIVQFRVVQLQPGMVVPDGNCYPKADFSLASLGTTPPWIDMQKVSFDEMEYYLFLSGTVDWPNGPSYLEFLVGHGSFEHVWHLPLPVNS